MSQPNPKPDPNVKTRMSREQRELDATASRVGPGQRGPLDAASGRAGDPAGTLGASLADSSTFAPPTAANSLLRVQRTLGNRHVQRLLARSQHQEEPELAVSPNEERAIDGARGNGRPLDSAVQSHMSQAFNADFSSVRVHTSTEADVLNHALNARAFTTDRDIFFRRGEYDPSSGSGRFLLAHELTHVVQQTKGRVSAGDSAVNSANHPQPADQSTLRITKPSDLYEQEADRMARAYSGWEQHVSQAGASETDASIQRKRSEDEDEKNALHDAVLSPGNFIMRTPQPGAARVGATSAGSPLPNQQETAVIPVGGEGYSRQMLRITAEIASGIGDLAEARALLLHPVAPNLAGLDAALAHRQRDFQDMQAWVDDESGFFGHHQSRVAAETARGWVGEHLGMLTKDRDEEQGKFQAFNLWVPEANAFYASLTRLQAQMNLLGVGSDLDSMVQGVLREIGVPAGEAQPAEGDRPAREPQAATGAQAVAARQIDVGRGSEPLPIPPMDNSVTQAGRECSVAFGTMQTAYIGLQQNFHALRIEQVTREGDPARERIQEINDIKQFVHSVGATIDTTAAIMNGAPAALSNATELINSTGARYGAFRNRGAMLRGEAARWNPTYTTIDAEGRMVVRNMQTGMDLDPTVAPGEAGRQRPSPGSQPSEGFPTIPTSIGGALDQIADFAYRDEVLKLNQLLAAVEARCNAERVARDFNDTLIRIRTYRDALNHYAAKAALLEQRMAERRRQYLEFGEALDRFAARDRQSQVAGRAPGHGRERYATVMVLAGQIREVKAMGQVAIESDEVGDRNAIDGWFVKLENHRTLSGHPPLTGFGRQSQIRRLDFPPGERQAIEEMATQSITFRLRAGIIIRRLSPVDAAFARLMTTLHPGGGSGVY